MQTPVTFPSSPRHGDLPSSFRKLQFNTPMDSTINSSAPGSTPRRFAMLMEMLLDIDDDPAWNSAEIEDEGAGEGDNYGVAQECLGRLAIAIGGNTSMPIAYELLQQYLPAPEWQKPHAALIALAQIAEGCAKVMLKNLEEVVSMVLNGFQHPHPRVRWAAINAIGQLSTDLGPNLQVHYHKKVLPALANAMDDSQNPRIQAHAALVLLNFNENCRPEILIPYLDGIVCKLLGFLQSGKQMVQEGALKALGSVAYSSQEHFKKYYDAVMLSANAIMMNATDKSNRMLLAKSLECVSLVGMAVGKDKFRDDSEQVVEVLMALQGTSMGADDPVTSFIFQAWARLCKCLGQDFVPYMNIVMPPLLQSAQLDPDVIITSAESDDDSIETIRTSVLEEKATACNLLCWYADELKEGFFPWIDQVALILVPLLKYYFHEKVRVAAVAAMPELLRSTKLAVGKGQAEGCDESYAEQLSNHIIPALIEALHEEPETEMCSLMLDSLHKCMQVYGPLLDQNQMTTFLETVKHVLLVNAAKNAERLERTKAEDFDADEEQLKEVFNQLAKCFGTLIKNFKASFLPFFDEFFVHVTSMLGEDSTPEERRLAICIFANVVEHCRESAQKYYETCLPCVLEASNDEISDIREVAVYCVGVCAEFGGHVSRPLAGEAVLKLRAVLRHLEAKDPHNTVAYDNAVSALKKVCHFQRDSIYASQSQMCKPSKAKWDTYDTRVLCTICVEELEAGRFSELWSDKNLERLIEIFFSRTGKFFSAKQLALKWNKQKQMYNEWIGLSKEPVDRRVCPEKRRKDFEQKWNCKDGVPNLKLLAKIFYQCRPDQGMNDKCNGAPRGTPPLPIQHDSELSTNEKQEVGVKVDGAFESKHEPPVANIDSNSLDPHSIINTLEEQYRLKVEEIIRQTNEEKERIVLEMMEKVRKLEAELVEAGRWRRKLEAELVEAERLWKKMHNTIMLSKYSSFEGVPYCKAHFEQPFKETGSYNKSFQSQSPAKSTPEKLAPELTRSPSKAARMFSGTRQVCDLR